MRDVLEAQIVVQGLQVDAPLKAGDAQQRFDFGSEVERFTILTQLFKCLSHQDMDMGAIRLERQSGLTGVNGRLPLAGRVGGAHPGPQDVDPRQLGEGPLAAQIRLGVEQVVGRRPPGGVALALDPQGLGGELDPPAPHLDRRSGGRETRQGAPDLELDAAPELLEVGRQGRPLGLEGGDPGLAGAGGERAPHQADRAVEDLATGGDVTPAEVLTAVQKADIAFRLMIEVRNKMVQAYEEIKSIRV